MLPQIGSSELLLIAVIALIVVGPKDLPILLRKVGQFIARLRGMANDFRTSFDDMARQSELEDLRREVAAMREAATAESNALNEHVAQLSEEVHAGAQPQMLPLDGAPPPQAEPFDPDPEAYRYAQETAAEKIIKRRARVAAAEGGAAKPARKPRAAKAETAGLAAEANPPRKRTAKSPKAKS